MERPLLGFCHGSPGTGKSRVIKWIRRMFEEAMGWKHEDEFLCVAFQNRVAHAMGGSTMHAGAVMCRRRDAPNRSYQHVVVPDKSVTILPGSSATPPAWWPSKRMASNPGGGVTSDPVTC